MKIEPIWLVGFVGHRPAEMAGRSEENLADSIIQVEKHLLELMRRCSNHGGHLELVSGLASGADLMFLQSARRFGIPVHLVLPCSVAEFLRDFDDKDDRARANDLIADAEKGESGITVRVVDGHESRPECYLNVNYEVIRASDALLALWDEKPARGSGGTGDAVAIAESVGVPVILVNPNDADRTPEFPAEPWPPECPMILRLNEELDKCNHMVLDGTELDPSHYGQIQAKLDWVADSSGSEFRFKNNIAIMLHFIAAMIAVLVVAFTPLAYTNHGMNHAHGDSLHIHLWPKILTGLELVIVVVAALLVAQVHNRHSQRVWRDCRIAAELLRGLIATRYITDPIKPLASSYGIEWKRLCLSAGIQLANDDSSRKFEALKDRYLSTRVAQQQRHFRTKLSNMGRIDRALTVVGWLCASTAPVVIGLALILKLIDPKGAIENWWSPWIVSVLPIALPMIAGTVATLMSALDLKRRCHRYEQISDRLTQHESVLRTRSTRSALAAEVAEVERLLLNDLWEWSGASKHIGH